MSTMDDFIDSLVNNREMIIDELIKNYSYDYLSQLFKNINDGSIKNGSIKNGSTEFTGIHDSLNDKYIYKFMTGKYQDSRYDKSALNWIPSYELVNALILLAETFNIKSIEEIYANLGILSGLIKKCCKPDISITTSDTFENIDTCNQLGITPVVRRDPLDFKYYDQLHEPCPQMIISSYYPSFMANDTNINFVNKMSDL